MKQRFIVEVKAKTADAAFAAAGEKLGKSRWFMAPSAEAVVKEVQRKLARVKENPDLYADKISAYEAMLDKWEKSQKNPRALAELMLDHGDARVDHPLACAIVPDGPGKFLIFGYHFDR